MTSVAAMSQSCIMADKIQHFTTTTTTTTTTTILQSLDFVRDYPGGLVPER